MNIHEYKQNPTVASGYWGGSTGKLIGGLCQQVFVNSNSDGNTFDVKITNSSDNLVRHYTDIVGQLNDLTPFPAYGVYTIEIINADNDEPFEVYLCFRE